MDEQWIKGEFYSLLPMKTRVMLCVFRKVTTQRTEKHPLLLRLPSNLFEYKEKTRSIRGYMSIFTARVHAFHPSGQPLAVQKRSGRFSDAVIGQI